MWALSTELAKVWTLGYSMVLKKCLQSLTPETPILQMLLEFFSTSFSWSFGFFLILSVGGEVVVQIIHGVFGLDATHSHKASRLKTSQ